MRSPYIFIILFLFSLNFSFAKVQQADVDLGVSDGSGFLNDEITLNISATNFTDVIAFQASINWDSTLVSYLSVSNFGVRDFSEGDFGTNEVGKGHLRFAWDASDGIAETIDGTVILFSVTFKIIDVSVANATVDFTDIVSTSPFPIEFANGSFEKINVNPSSGTVTLFKDPETLINVSTTADTSCDVKSPNGMLEADVDGDTINYIFHWYKGTQIGSELDFDGATIKNVAAGDYTLRTLNSDQSVFYDAISASVDDQTTTPETIDLQSKTDQQNCSENPAKQTGSLEISIKDEQPLDNYQISWWIGDLEADEELVVFRDQFSADGLSVGDYEVRVKDEATGCTSYMTTSINYDTVMLDLALQTVSNNYCGNAPDVTKNGKAIAEVSNTTEYDLRYYWFNDGDMLDTANARSRVSEYAGLPSGEYQVVVFDLNSECMVSGQTSVKDNEIYSEALVTLRDDTLFANSDNANWFRNVTFLNKKGAFLIPEESGFYYITFTNEYNCFSESDSLNYNVTGLEDLNSDILVYPNPFQDQVRISHSNEKLDFIRVYDSRGLLLQEFFDIKQKFIDLHLTSSSIGFYFIKIGQGDKISTRKVVKSLSK